MGFALLMWAAPFLIVLMIAFIGAAPGDSAIIDWFLGRNRPPVARPYPTQLGHATTYTVSSPRGHGRIHGAPRPKPPPPPPRASRTVVDGEGLVRHLLDERFPEYAEDDELIEHLGQLIAAGAAASRPPLSSSPTRHQQDVSDRFLAALEELTGESAHIGPDIVLQPYGGVMEYTYGSNALAMGLGEMTIKLSFTMRHP